MKFEELSEVFDWEFDAQDWQEFGFMKLDKDERGDNRKW
jgi:hypothetical protein